MTVIEIQSESIPAHKIVVAIDESQNSNKALEWAMDNVVSATVPTSISIVHVAQVPFSFVSTLGLSSDSGRAQAQDTAMKHGQAILDKALLKVTERFKGNKHVEAVKVLLQGETREAICDFLQRHDVMLCVIGSRGMGMIKRALMGSTSEYVVQHATCPTGNNLI